MNHLREGLKKRISPTHPPLMDKNDKKTCWILGFLAHLEQKNFLKISQNLWTDFHDCWLSGLNFFALDLVYPNIQLRKPTIMKTHPQVS